MNSTGTNIRSLIQTALTEEEKAAQAAAAAVPVKKAAPVVAEKLEGVKPAPAKPTVVEVVYAKVGDYVSFRSSDAGPTGLLKVQSIEENKLVLAHEDGSMWKAEKELVDVVRNAGRQRVRLTQVAEKIDDADVPVTMENLGKLGFKPAPKEDFHGANESTLFVDVPSPVGFTTLVYDFKPIGNKGTPALHAYYGSNDGTITESLACFSANATMKDIRGLIEMSKEIQPIRTIENRRIETVAELAECFKSSSKAVTV